MAGAQATTAVIRKTTRDDTRDDTRMNKEASRMRSEEVKQAVPKGENQWSDYPQHTLDPVNKARQAQKLT